MTTYKLLSIAYTTHTPTGDKSFRSLNKKAGEIRLFYLHIQATHLVFYTAYLKPLRYRT